MIRAVHSTSASKKCAAETKPSAQDIFCCSAGSAARSQAHEGAGTATLQDTWYPCYAHGASIKRQKGGGWGKDTRHTGGEMANECQSHPSQHKRDG